MPAKKSTVPNPYLTEYIYDCMVNATLEQKGRLNGKFLKHFKTSRSAKTFSANSSLEDKAVFLSKMGVPFTIVINMTKSKINELYGEGKNFNNIEHTNVMLREKVMVITDKQILTYLGLLASTCHSETWMLNRDFYNAGQVLNKWKKEHANPTVKSLKENLSASRELAKMMLHTILFSQYTISIFGINDVCMSVLLYFYSKEREFISDYDLRFYFSGVHKNFKMTNALTQLINNHYVETLAGKEKKYRITGIGCDIVLKFEKKVINLENY